MVVAQEGPIQVAGQLVAPPPAPVFGEYPGQLKGVQEQSLAEDGVEVSEPCFKAAAAVAQGALHQFPVVAAGLTAAKGLAPQGELKTALGIGEIELLVQRVLAAGLIGGQAAGLDLCQAGQAQLGQGVPGP